MAFRAYKGAIGYQPQRDRMVDGCSCHRRSGRLFKQDPTVFAFNLPPQRITVTRRKNRFQDLDLEGNRFTFDGYGRRLGQGALTVRGTFYQAHP